MQYLDPNEVIGARRTVIPPNPYVQGYGPKIPSGLQLQLKDKRWRRVYVMCWSNSGTAYVIVDNAQHILMDTAVRAFEDLADAPASRIAAEVSDLGALVRDMRRALQISFAGDRTAPNRIEAICTRMRDAANPEAAARLGVESLSAMLAEQNAGKLSLSRSSVKALLGVITQLELLIPRAENISPENGQGGAP